MKILRSIILHKNLVDRRTTRPQFLVVLTNFLVVEDTRTLEFCYSAGHFSRKCNSSPTSSGHLGQFLHIDLFSLPYRFWASHAFLFQGLLSLCALILNLATAVK